MTSDFKTILRDLGLLLHLPALLAVPALLVVVVAEEWFALPGFLLMALLSLSLGQILYRSFRQARESLSELMMLTVALAWLLIPILGAIPFVAVALLGDNLSPTTLAFRDGVNALFESMSGFTTTGLSVSQDPSTLPRSLQWWRSLIQWTGGVGVVVLALALIEPAEEDRGRQLYSAEARNRIIGDGIRGTALSIWGIYLLYTALAVAAFFVAGMPPWEALNHGLTGISTAGFTVTSDSFQTYSTTIKAVAIVIMTIGAISFQVHHMVLWRRDWRSAARQTQVRTFALLLIAGVLLLALLQRISGFNPAFIDTLFQWVSALGTCGFNSVALSSWSPSPLLLLVFAMVIGGASGSTTGGLKLSRLAWLAKGFYGQFRNDWTREDVDVKHTFNGEECSQDEARKRIHSAAVLAFLWMIVLFVGTLILLILMGEEQGLGYVLFDVTSALGSVGLSTGIVGPDLHPLGRLTLIVLMWMGRLEIMAVLVLLGAPLGVLLRYRKYG